MARLVPATRAVAQTATLELFFAPFMQDFVEVRKAGGA
jgi:hypothetical protein